MLQIEVQAPPLAIASHGEEAQGGLQVDVRNLAIDQGLLFLAAGGAAS